MCVYVCVCIKGTKHKTKIQSHFICTATYEWTSIFRCVYYKQTIRPVSCHLWLRLGFDGGGGECEIPQTVCETSVGGLSKQKGYPIHSPFALSDSLSVLPYDISVQSTSLCPPLALPLALPSLSTHLG